MKSRRRASSKRGMLTASAKHFRRVLYLALGVVISSYTVLFILVISKHLNQAAEEELRKASAASALDSSKTSFASGSSSSLSKFLNARYPAGNSRTDPGFEKFQERWAAIERVLKLAEAESPNPKRRVQLCNLPRFVVPPGPMTALASFPGSGNTWIRYLVQQSTGFLTGSIYRDYSLKRNGFPAENVANGSVLMIKTHEWGEKTRSRFQKVVLLLRDPYGALLAEFHRRAGGHVGHASPEKFYKGNSWRHFATTHSKIWMQNILDWLLFEGPLLVVRYEQMIQDLPNELLRLLKFLGVSELLTFRTFQCVVRNKDGIFRRAKRPLQFNPFDESLKKVIEGCKAVIEAAVSLREKGIKFYIQNTTVLALENTSFNYNHTSDSVMSYVEKGSRGDPSIDPSLKLSSSF